MKRLLVFLLAMMLATGVAPLALAENAAEPTTFTMMVSKEAMEGTWGDMWVVQHLEEMLNIKLEITEVTSEAFTEKMNLAFATNTLPNIFLNGLEDTDIVTYGSQGIILPLNDYINEEHTPNLVEIFEMYPQGRAALTYPDGNIYNLRGFNANSESREFVRARFFMNTQWLENVGMQAPATLDEFYDVLMAFKEQDANGNGDPDDEIPLGGMYGKNNQHADLVILAALGHLSDRVEAIDGEVVYVPAEPAYKEYLTYMNKLYTSGLLDPEYFTQTRDQHNAKMTEGIVGAFVNAAQWYNIDDPELWGQYDGIYPMTSDINDEQMWPANDITFIGHFILTNTLTDEEAQLAMKIPDFTYTMEGRAALTVPGVPRGTFEEYPDWGYDYLTNECPDLETAIATYKRQLTEVLAVEGFDSYNAFRHIYCHPTWGKFPTLEITEYLNPFRFELRAYVEESGEPWYSPTSPEAQLSRVIETYYVPYQQVGWPTVRMTAEENDRLGLIEADLLPYLEQMESKIIIGDLDISAYDEMVEGMRARGMDELIEIHQAAYDRWASS